MVLLVGMHGSEENSIKAVSDTVLGDNPTYGDIQPHKLKEMTNGAMTEQSQDNTAPTMASTLFQNANDRSLTINGSHSYEYVTTRRIDYGVHREHRDQVEGQGRPIEESTESSDIYYSIEYTQSRRTGVQLLQIKPATSQRVQLPSRTHSTQTFISSISIPQHYETMENVLSHKQITAISVDDSVTLHPMQ